MRYVAFSVAHGFLPRMSCIVPGDVMFKFHDTYGIRPELQEWFIRRELRRAIWRGLHSLERKGRIRIENSEIVWLGHES